MVKADRARLKAAWDTAKKAAHDAQREADECEAENADDPTTTEPTTPTGTTPDDNGSGDTAGSTDDNGTSGDTPGDTTATPRTATATPPAPRPRRWAGWARRTTSASPDRPPAWRVRWVHGLVVSTGSTGGGGARRGGAEGSLARVAA